MKQEFKHGCLTPESLFLMIQGVCPLVVSDPHQAHFRMNTHTDQAP